VQAVGDYDATSKTPLKQAVVMPNSKQLKRR